MRRFALLGVVASLGTARGESPPVDFSGPVATWPEYGGDAGGQRWSELDQITPENVSNLEALIAYALP